MKLKILFVLIVGLNFCVTNAQKREYEIRYVSQFTGIQVSSGINLYLKQGDDYRVSIEAEERFLKDIVTETKNGILHVYLLPENFIIKRRIVSEINVYVTFAQLESVSATAGSDVYCENLLKLDNFTVNSSSGADVRIDIECRQLTLNASSGSDIRAKGSTIKLKAIASSGSDIKARELDAIIATLNASSGSDIVAKVSSEIEVNVTSGSNISYYGNPFPVKIRQSGGGTVRKK